MLSTGLKAALCLGAAFFAVAPAPVNSAAETEVNREAVNAYNEGLELLSQGKYDEALGSFQAALALDPTYASALFAMGYALELKGQIPEAKKEYARALEADPQFAKAHYRMGTIELQEGNQAAAVRSFRSAVAADSTMVTAFVGLGMAHSEGSKWGPAIEAFQKALELDPQNPDANYRLGSAAYRLAGSASGADYSLAVTGFEKFLSLAPDHTNAAAANYYLGLIRFRQGDYQKALAHFETYTELSPTAAEGFYRLGKTLEKLSRRPEAIRAISTAAELKEDYGAAHYALARLYQQLHQDERALEQYQAAARDESFGQRAQARQAAASIEDYLRRKAEAERRAAEEEDEYE